MTETPGEGLMKCSAMGADLCLLKGMLCGKGEAAAPTRIWAEQSRVPSPSALGGSGCVSGSTY